MNIWPVQDAKARFSELLDACIKNGPQLVTCRGTEAAVLVPIDQWRRIKESSRIDLKTLLLSESAPVDLDLPGRQPQTRRELPVF